MASRFEQNKPDPAIKKNVLQTRSRHQGGKYAKAMVAGASVAVTILGWALISTQDANTLAQAQAAQSTRYTTTVNSQAQSTTDTLALTSSSTTGTSATAGATATATPVTVTSAQVTGSTVSAITSTRSSR